MKQVPNLRLVVEDNMPSPSDRPSADLNAGLEKTSLSHKSAFNISAELWKTSPKNPKNW